MQTYSFFDHGMTPAYQCSVDAEDLADAIAQVEALKFPMHRLTSVLGGVQIVMGPPGDPQYSTRAHDSRKEAIHRLLTMLELYDGGTSRDDVVLYRFHISRKLGHFHEVKIDDLHVEMAKYALTFPPAPL